LHFDPPSTVVGLEFCFSGARTTPLSVDSHAEPFKQSGYQQMMLAGNSAVMAALKKNPAFAGRKRGNFKLLFLLQGNYYLTW